jgi:hypothetical protein
MIKAVSKKLIYKRLIKEAKLIIPPSDRYDSIVNYLIEKEGIKITNNLKLCEIANFWNIKTAPKFLKFKNAVEPFLRLKYANIYTYRKFGESYYFLKSVKDFFHPYDFKLATFRNNGKREKPDKHFKANAQLGAFFWSLTCALDSFAWEAVIIYGIVEKTFRQIGFQKLLDYLKKIQTGQINSEQERLLKKLSDYILPLIETSGSEEDWYMLFNEYRHLFSHRAFPFLFFNQEGKIEPQAIKTYLQRDPLIIIEHPSKTDLENKNIEQYKEKYKKDYFLEQPLTEYCEMLFKKLIKVIDGCYSLLCEVYKDRCSGKVSYQTDYAKILPKASNYKFQKFTS